MNANMNEKGRQVKLLAAIAVLAMVVCAFAALVPSENVSGEVADTDVAYIGETGYASLELAFEDVKDGDTVYLNPNAAVNGVVQGNGIVFEDSAYPTGITIDFNGVTYDVNPKTVGSTGTETNGFQLLKGNTVTLTNGTITSTTNNCKILLQNYCNLTLDDMVVDGTRNTAMQYVSSNNCGNVTFTDNTIIKGSTADFAFDVCGYSSYTGVTVTIDENFTGQIDGKVKMTRSLGNNNPVNLNIKTDVTIPSLDVQTGTVTISDGVTAYVQNLTVEDGATINGKISQTIAPSEGETITSDDISNAFENNASGEVVVESGTISDDVSGITGDLVLGDDVVIEYTPAADGTEEKITTFSLGNTSTSTESGSITINANNDTFIVTGGENASVRFDGISGKITVTYGSVIINSTEYTEGKATITGDAEISGTVTGDFEIVWDTTESSTTSLDIDEKLTIEEGATLTLTDFPTDPITFNGGILDIRGTIVSNTAVTLKAGTGAINTYPTTNLVGVEVDGAEYVTDDVQFQFQGRLGTSTTINDDQSLVGDLWIPEGVTLTIGSGGVLNLNGFGIYVQGTLEVYANGAIKAIPSKSSGSVFDGMILLHRDGEIINDGVIGSGSTVTVSAEIAQKTEQTPNPYGTVNGVPSIFANADLGVNYTGVGAVTMQNVTGVTFSIENVNSVRYLTITGDITAYGMNTAGSVSATDVRAHRRRGRHLHRRGLQRFQRQDPARSLRQIRCHPHHRRKARDQRRALHAEQVHRRRRRCRRRRHHRRDRRVPVQRHRRRHGGQHRRVQGR